MWHISICDIFWTLICVIWLFHLCDVTHSTVWRDAFKCVTWRMHVFALTHWPSCLVHVFKFVRHDSIICRTLRIHMCGGILLCLCHDSFIFSAVWCSSLQCVAVGMTDSTQNATPEVHQIKKPLHMETYAYTNTHSSVSRNTNSNWDFILIGMCTEEFEFLNLVDFGGVAFSMEFAVLCEVTSQLYISRFVFGSLVVQCGAVRCSVLQCVAVRYSVLQCVTVCCSALQCVAVRYSVLQCVTVCCSVLQCVAVCYSVLQCVTVCCCGYVRRPLIVYITRFLCFAWLIHMWHDSRKKNTKKVQFNTQKSPT